MQTLLEFIDNPENVKGFVYFLCAGFMLGVWNLMLEIDELLMLARWRKAEKLRRKLENVI
jgi:hypothetical protein